MPSSSFGALPAGSGALIVDAIDDPGFGLNALLVCPPQQRRLVYTIQFRFQSDATVIGRRPWVVRTTTAAFVQGSSVYQIHNASLVNAYTFQTGIQIGNIIPGLFGEANSFLLTLPFSWWWYPGLDTRIVINNIQAGDSITNIRVFYERWLAN